MNRTCEDCYYWRTSVLNAACRYCALWGHQNPDPKYAAKCGSFRLADLAHAINRARAAAEEPKP